MANHQPATSPQSGNGGDAHPTDPNKMTWRTKCGFLCGATVALVMVLIPIGMFVVAPAIGQHVLDGTIIAVPNMTQSACPGEPTSRNNAWVINDAKISIPKLFGFLSLPTTLVSYTQEVYTTGCESGGMVQGGYACGENETEMYMGSYSSPEMSLKMGQDNEQKFNSTMHANMTVLQSAWTFPIFFGVNPALKARLILKAKDVTVKVLGMLTIRGLSMRNELTCTGIPQVGPTREIPNSVCYPDQPKHDPYTYGLFRAICESGRHSINTTTPTTPAPTTPAPTPSTDTTTPKPKPGKSSTVAPTPSTKKTTPNPKPGKSSTAMPTSSDSLKDGMALSHAMGIQV